MRTHNVYGSVCVCVRDVGLMVRANAWQKPLRGGQPQAYKAQAPAGGSMQVVFVSAEVAPWSITGGLGAVCDGLPRAMAKAGHRVMSIAPRYDQYFDAWDTEYQAEVPLGEATTTVRFFHCFKKGVDRVFVDHPLFLEKVRCPEEASVFAHARIRAHTHTHTHTHTHRSGA